MIIEKSAPDAIAILDLIVGRFCLICVTLALIYQSTIQEQSYRKFARLVDF